MRALAERPMTGGPSTASNRLGANKVTPTTIPWIGTLSPWPPKVWPACPNEVTPQCRGEAGGGARPGGDEEKQEEERGGDAEQGNHLFSPEAPRRCTRGGRRGRDRQRRRKAGQPQQG